MGEFAQTLHSGPMTVMLCCICNDHTDSLYVWRLEVFQQPMLVTDTRRDASVLFCVLPNRTRALDIYLRA